MIKASIFTISLSLLLFSFLGIVQAQDLLYTPHPNLDYVAVNNDVVSKEQEGFLKIHKQDTVKIAGIGSSTDTVKVSFDEYEYEGNIDEYGNWFVLFSVQDMQVGSYPVSVQFNDGKEEHLITLVIQEGDMEVSDYSTPQEDTKEVVEQEDGFNIMYIGLIVLVPVLIGVGTLLGIQIQKRSSKLKKVKRDE